MHLPITGNLPSHILSAIPKWTWRATRHTEAIIYQLAGHPLRGWPARLRGHKGSGLWKVWTVPSPPLPLPSPPLPSPPLPSPPLPCPALPSPALPSPPLPCPALPSPPLPSPPLPSPPLPSPPLPPLPPSLPRTLFRVRPRSNLAALWITAETAISRYWWARVWRRPAITKWKRSQISVSATKKVFFKTSNYASCDWNGD